jgi:acyl-homoserine-lactone acylase
MRRGYVVAAIVAGALLALAAVPAFAVRHHRQTPFSAVIRRTAHGIPHIQASTYTGIGYGYGYAFAQDNICTIAEDYVTVDGQRSRFFGPGGSYVQGGNGISSNNLNSDLFWQQVIDSHVVERLLAQPPPKGPKPAVRDVMRGYVAGYNRYLADVGGTNGVPDRTCRGKPWVRPITQADAYRRLYQLVLLASSGIAIDGIAGAQPPTPSLPVPSLPSPLGTAQSLEQGLAHTLGTIGSNAVAIGSGGTRDHRHGLLLGNPHFPWAGTERFYQAQLTIPGQLDVEGASLFGVPLVLIGHTRDMAWSHTVSTARRFTLYQLTLVPGDPTAYVYDGHVEHMSKRTVSADGTARTLYTSRFGPIVTSLVGVPLPWTPTTAFALADANADNLRVLNHFLDTDRAQSAPQELAILKRYEGIPWVNTIVADRHGHALYADIGAVPNLSNAAVQRCDTPIGAATFQVARVPVLDGSRSACNWASDADAVEPGIFGPGHLPHLYRSDYVTNSNDSYWLSNPHQPLTGFATIIGDEGTARTLRTRIGLIMTQAIVDAGGFTRQAMQQIVFSDRQYGGELVRDDLLRMCRSLPGGLAPTTSGAPVAVGPACDILARWDLHENLGSKGAVLFRRFWERALASTASPWSHPFDVSDPVHTPYGLNTANPQVRAALGDAINDLNGAHIALDAAPRDVQAITRNGHRIPIHGGPGDPNGEFNAIYTDFTSGAGFGEPYTGSSYVQAVTWHSGPCPDARTILTYSESTNPGSPWFADQTAMFSRKQWVRELFCGADVARGTRSTTTVVQGAHTRTRRR